MQPSSKSTCNFSDPSRIGAHIYTRITEACRFLARKLMQFVQFTLESQTEHIEQTTQARGVELVAPSVKFRLTSEPRRRCSRRRVARGVRWRSRCRCCCGGTSSPEVAPGARAAAPFAPRPAPRAVCPMDGSEERITRSTKHAVCDRRGSRK